MGEYRDILAQVALHIDQGIALGESITLPKQTDRIIWCGMGGSAIVGDVLSSIVQETPLEIIVNKNSQLPSRLITSKTVVVISSYSGNTAETISCYRSAVKHKAQILVISSGGMLVASAHRQKYPLIVLPQGFLPRQVLYIQLCSMIQVLTNSELLANQSTAIAEFKSHIERYPFARRSNAIAKGIDANIPIIYASPALASGALRWRTQINENAKTLCFSNIFTELNHNEIEGYDNKVSGVSVIMLRRDRENKIVGGQMDAFAQLVRSQVDSLKMYDIPGRSIVATLLNTIYLGDWVSYQLAELKGHKPGPVEMITRLKSML